jgi:hypothetical protein
MGEYQPARSPVARRVRDWARTLYRHIVHLEPVYILPWIASRDYRTSILLENNQTAYMRRRSGRMAEATIAFRRYDAEGRAVDTASYVVKPGVPVVVNIASQQPDLEYGFVQLTEFAQVYAQIVGTSTCALTHGRSTVIMHCPPLASALLRVAPGAIYRKGFNWLEEPDSYQTTVFFNLSSIENRLRLKLHCDESGLVRTESLTLPPYGSRLVRLRGPGSPTATVRRGYLFIRATGPLDFYVLQTTVQPSHEAFSIQHVN